MANKRVLVVDDEPEVTLALQVFFLGKGYEMLTALDGVQAMRLLKQHPVDLVLLDMKMPGVNGVEVLKFIRSEAPSTRVIVVTAYDVQFQEIVEQIGVDGFLMKPFGIQALTQKVQEVLAGRPAAPAAPDAEITAERQAAAGRARARLLFVEPSDYTYGLKEVFFADPEKAGGSFDVQGAYSTEEALEKLATFHPDILLVDLTMLGHASDLTVRVMESGDRPKEVILHGSSSALSPSQSSRVHDLSRIGVKVIQNESFTRAGLARLAEVVQKTALELGLRESGTS
ncbi:MAG: response regulator [Candidatus Omnitrophica bacterium]|nr:response regulator [Candidatus Omnitrophota bacterium]